MESKLFSYKVEGIVLEPANDILKVSEPFDRKELLNKIKEVFKDQDFKVEEQSLDYKIIDGQLYIQGLVVKQQELRSIGFMTSK
ncbi:hypothetical protein SAMN05216464_101555 [Mucilaginibacter pineti]|uniref:Uncharacterized protein n=1 Tax=Mucilaginibacter pineti TaxID=1391627 RepID=A0A1G6U709_9SPHI|nr:hypothetical protein [Mucilaginibacter pineti]SDD37170.1 hypothetical protein SAMN05216464_101555 [Mucilaginibacter pineti]